MTKKMNKLSSQNSIRCTINAESHADLNFVDCWFGFWKNAFIGLANVVPVYQRGTYSYLRFQKILQNVKLILFCKSQSEHNKF